MPPLYYFLLHGWGLVSQEVWFLRSLNILISLAAVFLVYRITKPFGGEAGALWAALFTALSPLQIYHAQDLRMYAVLSLAQLGYIGCFLTVIRKPVPPSYRHPAWIGLILCGAAAMYSHNLAVVVMPIPFLYALIKRNWVLFRSLTFSHLAIGVLVIPWLVQIPGQISKIQAAFWTPRPGLVEVFQSIILFHSQLPLPAMWLAVAAVVSLQVLVLVGIEGWRLLKSRKSQWTLLGFLFGPPVFLFILSYAMRPVFVTRAFLVSALVYTMLAGWVVGQGRMAGRVLVTVGIVILSVIGLVSHTTYNRFPRSPFQETMAYIASQIEPGDRIIHDNKLSYFPSYLSEPSLQQVFLQDAPGTANDTLAPATQEALNLYPVDDMEDATHGATRVHFVVFQEATQDYIQAGYPAHPYVTWLEGHGRRTGFHTIEDLDVYTYELGSAD